MKSYLSFVVSMVLFVSSGYSQQWLGSSSSINNIYRNGDVTASEGDIYRVTIGSGYEIYKYGGRGYIGFNLRRNSSGQWSYLNDGAMNDGAAILHGWNSILFSIKSSTGASNGNIVDNDVANNIVMQIKGDGKVVIGNTHGTSPYLTNLPGNYRLYVQSGILAEKVKVAVANSSYWSDHVFADDYHLKPLTEVENFIQTNKRLPDVPSAEEVVTEGIDLGAMDAKLLQKIEELTLYVIQQQKQIEDLKTEILKQKSNSDVNATLRKKL